MSVGGGAFFRPVPGGQRAILTNGWGAFYINSIVSRGKNTTNYGVLGDTLSLLGAFSSKFFYHHLMSKGNKFLFYYKVSWGSDASTSGTVISSVVVIIPCTCARG